MSDKPQVSIVIVNYNTYDYTAQCLNSIHAATLELPYEIVVVDNASFGDDVERLSEHYPDIVLVKSQENKGIAGGNNLGIRAGSSEYVLLLNNDTLVRKGSIERAVQFLEKHRDAAGVGGNLLNPDGSFQSGYVDFPSLWSEFLFATRLELFFRPSFSSHPPASTVREADWLSTAFMLFRRHALEGVGLVDEEFFIYSDETDLEYRLKRAGWKLYYLPELNTVHFGGKSLTPWRRRRMLYRGKILFFKKHYGLFRTAILRLLFAGVSLLKLMAWTALWLLPRWRHRARLEIASYQEVVQLCYRLN